jgi:hypothetical protein
MSDEIVKQEPLSAIQALRALMTLDTDDRLSVLKTALKDGKSGLAARGLSLIQRWNEERFCEAFCDEVEEMRQAGRIREDFNRTDAGVSSVQEFFELIDGKPNEKHFRAFCALFMSANAPDADANQAIIDLELMKILRNLSAGEMHLLFAVVTMGYYAVGDDLLASISKHLGYRSDTLLNKNMSVLLNQHLVSEINWENRGGAKGERKELLTDLGVELAKRVRIYNEFKKQQAATSAT